MAVIEHDQIQHEGMALVAQAQAITIRTVVDFDRAGELLRTAKAYLGRIAEVFDPIDASQIAARKVTIAQRKGLEEHALTAERVLKTGRAAYERQQEAQRRAQAEAAERERQRLEKEAQAVAKVEQARLQKEAEDAALTRASAAEAMGDTATAERIISTLGEVPVVVPAPVFVPPPPPAPKLEGVFQDRWSAEVTDLYVLVKAVAEGRAAITLLLPNEPALNQMARALKGALAVPGVRAISTRTEVVR